MARELDRTPYERDPTSDFAFLDREIGSRPAFRRLGAILLLGTLLVGLGATATLVQLRVGTLPMVVYFVVVALILRSTWNETNPMVFWGLMALFFLSVIWLFVATMGEDGSLEFRANLQRQVLPFRVAASLLWITTTPPSLLRRLWRGLSVREAAPSDL